MRVHEPNVLMGAAGRHPGERPRWVRHPAAAAHRYCLPSLQVLDEPLYAHYLTLTGAPRPYTELVLQSQDADGNRLLRDLLSGQGRGGLAACSAACLQLCSVHPTQLLAGQTTERPQRPPHPGPRPADEQRRVLYCKHMAKHRIGVSRELLRQGRHFLLVRWGPGHLDESPMLLAQQQQRQSRAAAPFMAASSPAPLVSCLAPAVPYRSVPVCLPAWLPCREPGAVIQSFSEVLEPTLQVRRRP